MCSTDLDSFTWNLRIWPNEPSNLCTTLNIWDLALLSRYWNTPHHTIFNHAICFSVLLFLLCPVLCSSFAIDGRNVALILSYPIDNCLKILVLFSVYVAFNWQERCRWSWCPRWPLSGWCSKWCTRWRPRRTQRCFCRRKARWWRWCWQTITIWPSQNWWQIWSTWCSPSS